MYSIQLNQYLVLLETNKIAKPTKMIRSSGASPMAIGTRNGIGQRNRDVVGIPVKRERPNSHQGIPRGPVGRDFGRDRRLHSTVGQCNAGGEGRNQSGSSACSAFSVSQQWKKQSLSSRNSRDHSKRHRSQCPISPRKRTHSASSTLSFLSAW